MTREQTFVFSFTVSRGFVTNHSDAGASFIELSRQRIANQVSSIGPRGGTYVLDKAEPLVWFSSDGADPFDFARGLTRHWTRRTGRYVRPSRAPLLPNSLAFATVTIPVTEGAVTLPDGRHIETESRFVDVPVLV